MLKIVLTDGVELEAETIEGGGMHLGGLLVAGFELTGRYLIDVSWPDGRVSQIPQDQIARIVDMRTGEEVEFGSPLFPGHPSARR